MEAQRAAAEDGDKHRFGLNSLIHRMTGGARARDVAPPAPSQPRREPSARAEHPVRSETGRRVEHEEAQEDDEDLRMEIPAFLRRQAN